MQFEFDIVAVVVLGIGIIGSFFRMKYRSDNLEEKMQSLEVKQQNDHQMLVTLQVQKEKALWDQMNTFRDTMMAVVQGLGRVEGKIDSITKRDN